MYVLKFPFSWMIPLKFQWLDTPLFLKIKVKTISIISNYGGKKVDFEYNHINEKLACASFPSIKTTLPTTTYKHCLVNDT